MEYLRSLRLAGLGAVAAATVAFSIPSAQARDSFSFGFSDRGGGFSVGVNQGRYRHYGYPGGRYYGPRYYPPPYYSNYDPYWRGRWQRSHHRTRVYDPRYGRYIWVWR